MSDTIDHLYRVRWNTASPRSLTELDRNMKAYGPGPFRMMDENANGFRVHNVKGEYLQDEKGNDKRFKRADFAE